MALPILGLIAGAQALLGASQVAKGARDFNSASKARTPYSTPDELYDILKATQQNAQSGFDPRTLQFLESQGDRAFSSGLASNQRLGGDSNAAAMLFDQQMQNIFKVGAQNHALQLENFSKYMSSLDMIATNKTAEWSSQQDILKDRMAAANTNRQAGWQNVQGAVNLGVAAYAQSETEDMGSGGGGGVGGGYGGFGRMNTIRGVSPFGRGAGIATASPSMPTQFQSGIIK